MIILSDFRKVTKMQDTTALDFEKFKIAKTSVEVPQPVGVVPYMLSTLQLASSATAKNEAVTGDHDFIASTFGKYKTAGVNMTNALLAEHQAERDRDSD